MSIKPNESWAGDPAARALRVELPDGNSLLLKHDHLIYAKLTVLENEQQLALFYSTHEVRIHGHALRRIEIAVQRMELSFITASIRSATQPVDGQPVIRELVVTEVERGTETGRKCSATGALE